MCFSTTASLVSGTFLSIGGIYTLSKVKDKAAIPFGAIPLIFGVQQLVEGLVWSSFPIPWLNVMATFVYALFAYVFWPVFGPFAVLCLEKNKLRRKILAVFWAIGIAVGAYLLYFVLTTQIVAQVVNNCIAYTAPRDFSYVTMGMYIIATSFSCLLSSHRMVKVFGAALFGSFVFAYAFFIFAFTSVWCFFGALLSVIVYLHFALDSERN